jgi:pyruvate dehydrogenase E1 component alpha subunit
MDKAEYAAAVADDPLPKLRARLLSDGIADEAGLTRMESEILEEIDAAATAALAADYPDVSELKRDVFAHEIA